MSQPNRITDRVRSEAVKRNKVSYGKAMNSLMETCESLFFDTTPIQDLHRNKSFVADREDPRGEGSQQPI